MVSEDIRERVVSYMRHQAGKPTGTIIDLVRTSQERFLAQVDGVAEERARAKPAPQEWSLGELTRHVIAAQEGAAHLVGYLARDEAPPRRPGGIGMMLDEDGATLADLVARLRRTNQAMLDTLRDMPQPPATSMTRAHQFFGELNALEWAVFQRVHDEDHVQHAQKILAAV
jgi:hypothetical protein